MSITQPAESPDTPHANDELLTMKEVANVVRVPVATLRYWRHLGVPGHKVGDSRLVGGRPPSAVCRRRVL